MTQKHQLLRKEPRRTAAATTTALVGLVSSILLVTGCHRQAENKAAPPVPEVSTLTLAPREVLLTTELPGRTSPFRIAEIRPQVNGLIQKRFYTEGSDVQARQDLYQIDPAPFEAALANAKAALGRANANLPAVRSRALRYKDALAEKAVSQQDYDDASAALKQAEADVDYFRAMVETARINLEYTHVSSPISGRVGPSSVTEGAIVTAYQPVALATIQQLDPIYVDVTQSTRDVIRLIRRLEEKQIHREGTNFNQVELIMEDGSKYPWAGTMQFRDVSVDLTTSSVVLRMIFPNPKGMLLPGMFVRAVVKEGINEHALLIPQRAVSRDQKGNPITLVLGADSKVEQRSLNLDRAIGNDWLVTEGLAAGEKVIMEGSQRVHPGAEAKDVPFGTGARSNGELAKTPANRGTSIN